MFRESIGTEKWEKRTMGVPFGSLVCAKRFPEGVRWLFRGF